MNRKATFAHYIIENSIFFKINFGFKFMIFSVLGIITLFRTNIFFYLVIFISLTSLLNYIGFFRSRPNLVKFLRVYVVLFSLFRLLLSKIPGRIIITWPWDTYLSYTTFYITFITLIKSLNILLLGLVFISTCSEDELVNFLLQIKLHKKYVLMLSIALNTFNFILQDIEITSESLRSRQYNEVGIIQKMKKIYYIGSNIILSHMKKIQILTENFSIKEKNYE